uniref:RRM domain-containing protein n=1 Tax=Picea sitchensis TaxID=3332 RepID=D5ACZ8_PICSI|nr:unknown [Picea sitchensis]
MEFLKHVGGLARCSLLRHHLTHQSYNGAPALPLLHVTTRGLASSKLFVGGLAWHADEKTIKDAFSTYGDVTEGWPTGGPVYASSNTVRIMYDRDSGRSRGFGFIHFSNESSAEDAKNGMDGKELLGRPLRIDYAIDKPAAGRSRVVPRLSPLHSNFDRITHDEEEHKLFRNWNSG